MWVGVHGVCGEGAVLGLELIRLLGQYGGASVWASGYVGVDVYVRVFIRRRKFQWRDGRRRVVDSMSHRRVMMIHDKRATSRNLWPIRATARERW